MIVDTSALVAILRDEDVAGRFVAALASDPPHKMSAGSQVEPVAVTSDWGEPDLLPILDRILAAFEITCEPVAAEQARVEPDAYRRFGKGRYRARLNSGDYFAYALAKSTGEPLLFRGCDFVHTDIMPALPARP